MTLVCDDCVRARPALRIGPQCFAFCSFCKIKRACYGDDPEPQAPRHFSIRPRGNE